MSKASIPTRSRIDLARTRLEKAVSEAEAAVDRYVQTAGGKAEVPEELQQELRSARAENAELRQVNQQVSERLDHVILRLKTVLES